MNESIKYILATAGILIFGIALALYYYYNDIAFYFAQPEKEEVHVHADFLFVLLDTKVDFTGEKYQSDISQILHQHIHFHDGVDTMIHRHAEGITLGDFFSSLQYTLSNSCVTTDSAVTYCSDTQNTLQLFVNSKNVEDIANYVIQEKDQILLFYGPKDSEKIKTFQSNITDEACMYSGTCPERGEPPFESCGLTCEI